jgi:glyoxylase-like metal-dependent hydrolase (beta-lactamase superfamily II)
MPIQSFCFNPIQVNSYLLWDDDLNALIIDPGCYTDKEKSTLQEFIQNNKLVLRTILNTHLHFDHILGNNFVEKTYSVGSQAHKDDLFLLNQLPLHARLFGVTAQEICEPPATLLEDGATVHCGNISLRVVHAPGHSPGSLAIIVKTKTASFRAMSYSKAVSDAAICREGTEQSWLRACST